RDAFFLLGCQFCPPGRDPERGRLAVGGQPCPGVAERPVDKETPECEAVLGASVAPAQRPAPKWIVLERQSDDRSDAVAVSERRAPRAHLPVHAERPRDIPGWSSVAWPTTLQRITI